MATTGRVANVEAAVAGDVYAFELTMPLQLWGVSPDFSVRLMRSFTPNVAGSEKAPAVAPAQPIGQVAAGRYAHASETFARAQQCVPSRAAIDRGSDGGRGRALLDRLRRRSGYARDVRPDYRMSARSVMRTGLPCDSSMLRRRDGVKRRATTEGSRAGSLASSNEIVSANGDVARAQVLQCRVRGGGGNGGPEPR